MSDRADWLAWRADGIGGSDAAALVGVPGAYGSPWSLWADKCGLVPERAQSQRMRIGQLLEPAIGQLFHEIHPHLWLAGEQTWMTHERLDWARCTVDGFVYESDAERDPDDPIADALGVHEIKTTHERGWVELPVHIRAQCVWQMGVTGLRHCWVSVMFGGFDFDVYEIDWDADAKADWELMRDEGDRFWHEHVLPTRAGKISPPEIDGSDATYRALLAVYPDHEPGERVALDDLRDVLIERESLTERAKRIDQRLDEIRNELLATFGDAELGTIDGEPVLSARWSDRKSIDADAVRAAHGATYDKRSRVRTLRAASKRDRKAA